MGTSQDMLVAPACGQALEKKFIFVWMDPLALLSIKGPESSPSWLTLSTCCYSLKQARTWGEGKVEPVTATSGD